MNTAKDHPKTPFKPAEFEKKWQAYWEEHKTFSPNLDNASKPYYTLMMFPYPSAEGMHVGNVYAQTGADIHGRFKRMQGFDVFEPIGLDGFGIHSENYALKIGKHPKEQAKISEQNFYRQMHETGTGFDWQRTLETYDPEYYKWTQWLFIQMFKAGLAYRKKANVNFCPSCKTVLSDEQVIAGECERCGSIVEKRELEQWFFKITDYAERLLENIKDLDWTEKVKTAQTNWIGKSTGALITFALDQDTSSSSISSIQTFTTRPDTLFGATFLVIAPEHPIVKSILDLELDMDPEQVGKVRTYVEEALKKGEKERIADGKDKTGVFSGVHALNPATGARVPIWIADYVLGGYGTGAIMAVPAHDQRDYEFAKKYDLPITSVIVSDHEEDNQFAYVGDGLLQNSGDWDGYHSKKDIDKILADIAENGWGQAQNEYHLRDWLISRQRYWGPPIPMVFCQSCADASRSWFTENASSTQTIGNSNFQLPISNSNSENDKSKMENGKPAEWSSAGWFPEESLPVLLPDIEDFKPQGKGKSPLANHPEFYEVPCPGCGGKGN